MMRPHALVIGGTGMLRQVAVHLARQDHTVSVIARDIERLRAVVDATQHADGVVNVIPVDYHDSAALAAAIREAAMILGPVTLAVSWIHTSAAEAPYAVADAINQGGHICRFFDVLGSSAGDPAHPMAEREERFRAFAHIRYRRIVLGFCVENDGSRWLTNEEIQAGVLEALAEDQVSSIIGTVSPWSRRPPVRSDLPSSV